MDLKTLLGEELYQQVQTKIDEHNAAEADDAKRVKLVDLSEGQYIGRNKYEANIGGLNQKVKDLESQVAQRDADLADLNGKLSSAQADATKLTEAQQAVSALQAKYDKDREDWIKKSEKQRYEFMVKEQANGLKFSSNAAKKEFIRDAIAAGFKVDGESLIGYTDFLNKYKSEDPSAFVDETDESTDDGQPMVVLPRQSGTDGNSKSSFPFAFSGVRPRPEE